MKDRPILFNGEMVCATLDGRKTQTRRVCESQPYSNGFHFDGHDILCHNDYLTPSAMLMDIYRGKYSYTMSNLEGWEIECPYGQPGDRLWVREKCSAEELPNGDDGVRYLADGAWLPIENTREAADRWIALNAYRGRKGATVPSIHMPRWASRITLEITNVRVERLQEISEADAEAEGVKNSFHLSGGRSARENFAHLWWRLHGDDAWEANPWVWRIEFKRIGAADREETKA